MNLDIDTIRSLQAYGYAFAVMILSFILYAYWFHLKRSEKTGRRNYEKYGNLVIDDELSDEIIEPKRADENEKKEQ